ncbi:MULTISPECIES: DUF397 domain-containing protein [unclassified Saccharothrix]|uniref:DUF397 domain-containing protein n=1 Tax=unclassified Saccharothrix TaxID=2593673 RepID=UPI00307D00F5
MVRAEQCRSLTRRFWRFIVRRYCGGHLVQVGAVREGVPVGAADSASELWRKSTYSENSGCVEVSLTAVRARVRNTRNTAGEQLAFPASAWADFLRFVGDR